MAKKEELIVRILKSPTLKHMDEEGLLHNFEGVISALTKLDCTTNEIFYIVSSWLGIVEYKEETLKENIRDLLLFGFDKIAVKRMAKDNSHVLTDGIEVFKTALNNFGFLGVNKPEFLKMAKDDCSIVKFTLETLLDKRLDIMSLGFSSEEFLTMIKIDSSTLVVSLPTIEAHMDNLRGFDYKEEEIRHIIIYSSGILTRSLDTIHDKLTALGEIGLLRLIAENPMRLRQSANLTRAKAYYLTSHDIPPSSPSGINYLFASSEQFRRLFGVTNQGVEALYALERELQEKRIRLARQGGEE